MDKTVTKENFHSHTNQIFCMNVFRCHCLIHKTVYIIFLSKLLIIMHKIVHYCLVKHNDKKIDDQGLCLRKKAPIWELFFVVQDPWPFDFLHYIALDDYGQIHMFYLFIY